MATPTLSPLEQQLRRVRRRLYLQTFLNVLPWCWGTALLLAAGWFLLQPLAIQEPPAGVRWAVAGSLFALLTVAAVWIAVRRTPSRLLAALALDERFDLRERVTTSLTLDPQRAQSDVGQALLTDVNERVAKLDVASRFPVALTRSALMVPIAALAFALVAFLYHPSPATAVAQNPDAEPPIQVAKLDEKLKELQKKALERKKFDRPDPARLKEIDAKLEEIANRPRRTKEELRERMKEMKALEDQMRKTERGLTERTEQIQQQLKKLDQLNEGAREGPARDLQKALKDGDLQKAREQLAKLGKEMSKMSQQEKQQLAKQMKQMGDKLKKLADQEEKKKELEQKRQKGEISKETFNREMKQLEQQSKSLQEMKDLAEKMQKCSQCMQQGDTKGAQQQMQQAQEQLKAMDGNEKDLDDLRDQMQRLSDAKKAAGASMGKDQQKEPQANDSDQPNNGGVGAGRRGQGEDKGTRSFDARVRAQFDPKGRKIFDGYAPGQNVRKKSTAEIFEDIQQARQEASEVIEQQRIPKSAADVAKGYFRNLGGQAETKKPPAP